MISSTQCIVFVRQDPVARHIKFAMKTLEAHQSRMIADSEIGLPILFCSLETYCNPSCPAAVASQSQLLDHGNISCGIPCAKIHATKHVADIVKVQPLLGVAQLESQSTTLSNKDTRASMASIAPDTISFAKQRNRKVSQIDIRLNGTASCSEMPVDGGLLFVKQEQVSQNDPAESRFQLPENASARPIKENERMVEEEEDMFAHPSTNRKHAEHIDETNNGSEMHTNFSKRKYLDDISHIGQRASKKARSDIRTTDAAVKTETVSPTKDMVQVEINRQPQSLSSIQSECYSSTMPGFLSARHRNQADTIKRSDAIKDEDLLSGLVRTELVSLVKQTSTPRNSFAMAKEDGSKKNYKKFKKVHYTASNRQMICRNDLIANMRNLCPELQELFAEERNSESQRQQEESDANDMFNVELRRQQRAALTKRSCR